MKFSIWCHAHISERSRSSNFNFLTLSRICHVFIVRVRFFFSAESLNHWKSLNYVPRSFIVYFMNADMIILQRLPNIYVPHIGWLRKLQLSTCVPTYITLKRIKLGRPFWSVFEALWICLKTRPAGIFQLKSFRSWKKMRNER